MCKGFLKEYYNAKKYFSMAAVQFNITLQNKKENIKEKADKIKFKLSQVSYK